MIRQKPPAKALEDRKYLISTAKLLGVERHFGKKISDEKIHTVICKKLRPKIQKWLDALNNNTFEPYMDPELLQFYMENENCIARFRKNECSKTG